MIQAIFQRMFVAACLVCLALAPLSAAGNVPITETEVHFSSADEAISRVETPMMIRGVRDGRLPAATLLRDHRTLGPDRIVLVAWVMTH